MWITCLMAASVSLLTAQLICHAKWLVLHDCALQALCMGRHMHCMRALYALQPTPLHPQWRSADLLQGIKQGSHNQHARCTSCAAHHVYALAEPSTASPTQSLCRRLAKHSSFRVLKLQPCTGQPLEGEAFQAEAALIVQAATDTSAKTAAFVLCAPACVVDTPELGPVHVLLAIGGWAWALGHGIAASRLQARVSLA